MALVSEKMAGRVPAVVRRKARKWARQVDIAPGRTGSMKRVFEGYFVLISKVADRTTLVVLDAPHGLVFTPTGKDDTDVAVRFGVRTIASRGVIPVLSAVGDIGSAYSPVMHTFDTGVEVTSTYKTTLSIRAGCDNGVFHSNSYRVVSRGDGYADTINFPIGSVFAHNLYICASPANTLPVDTSGYAYLELNGNDSVSASQGMQITDELIETEFTGYTLIPLRGAHDGTETYPAGTGTGFDTITWDGDLTFSDPTNAGSYGFVTYAGREEVAEEDLGATYRRVWMPTAITKIEGDYDYYGTTGLAMFYSVINVDTGEVIDYSANAWLWEDQASGAPEFITPGDASVARTLDVDTFTLSHTPNWSRDVVSIVLGDGADAVHYAVFIAASITLDASTIYWNAGGSGALVPPGNGPDFRTLRGDSRLLAVDDSGTATEVMSGVLDSSATAPSTEPVVPVQLIGAYTDGTDQFIVVVCAQPAAGWRPEQSISGPDHIGYHSGTRLPEAADGVSYWLRSYKVALDISSELEVTQAWEIAISGSTPAAGAVPQDVMWFSPEPERLVASVTETGYNQIAWYPNSVQVSTSFLYGDYSRAAFIDHGNTYGFSGDGWYYASPFWRFASFYRTVYGGFLSSGGHVFVATRSRRDWPAYVDALVGHTDDWINGTDVSFAEVDLDTGELTVVGAIFQQANAIPTRVKLTEVWSPTYDATTGDIVDHGVFLAATIGDEYPVSEFATSSAVYVSLDTGATWAKLVDGQSETGVHYVGSAIYQPTTGDEHGEF